MPAPLTVSPNELDFYGLNESMDVTAQQNLTGVTIEATTQNCSGIATVAQSSRTFTVTSVGVGTCNYTITSSNGQSANLAVIVTATSGTIQTHPATQSL